MNFQVPVEEMQFCLDKLAGLEHFTKASRECRDTRIRGSRGGQDTRTRTSQDGWDTRTRTSPEGCDPRQSPWRRWQAHQVQAAEK